MAIHSTISGPVHDIYVQEVKRPWKQELIMLVHCETAKDLVENVNCRAFGRKATELREAINHGDVVAVSGELHARISRYGTPRVQYELTVRTIDIIQRKAT
jgi:hypothetical protein